MDNRDNSTIGNFIVNNAKAIITFIVFVCGLYVQYQASMMKMAQMEVELSQIKAQIDDQYVKLDNMKLDKTVFDATVRQLSDMSTDIREIRDRLETILGDHQRHYPQKDK